MSPPVAPAQEAARDRHRPRAHPYRRPRARGHRQDGYTLFTPEADELIRRAGRTYLVFCGIATESCVLKSAADAFEHVYAPWIVADALASGVGPDIHDAGLVVACGLIGTGQLVTAEHVVGQLTACAGAPVLE
ncbi:isochorismatase family protein [Streptomyces atratus]|uniref:isochorismatase family protein n=1 Tax=Streptomyces atratus TaxID=1893 RepID=UPI0037DA3F74